jgi:hypothetical protein
LFDETYVDGYNFDCTKNRSYLNYQSGNISTNLEIELNPNCSEVYGKDEIDIALFMTEYIKKPVIVIVSNNPAFVPVYVYVFNEEKNTYVFYKGFNMI